MGEMIDVTRDSFRKDVLESEQPVLVDFWAHWSGPCRHLEPILDEIAQEQTGYRMCRVNVERETELAGAYSVAATPTLMIFEHGQKKRVSTGSRSKENVMDFLEGAQYESLD